MNNASSNGTAAATSKPFCDLCWKRDGKDGLTLLRCKQCHVYVHKECYGWLEPPKNNEDKDEDAPSLSSADYDFTCWACLAVGTVVKVREREKGGKQRKHIKIIERPTECCLCSVDEGMDVPHAMHPMFDDYGPRARQILLRAERKKSSSSSSSSNNKAPAAPRPERTAWAHTLCAMTISCQPGGVLYGLNRDGKYDADYDDDAMDEDNRQCLIEDDDSNSINSVIQPPKGSCSSSSRRRAKHVDTITHFAIVSKKFYKPSSSYMRHLMGYKKLKCVECGSDDSANYRIPIHCMAGQEDEFQDFQGCHDFSGNDTCYQAMHIGCAFYGKNEVGEYPGVRRVWYFPGDAGKEAVANTFCLLHATDLVKVPNCHADRVKYPGPTAPLLVDKLPKKQSRLYLQGAGSEKQQLLPHPPSDESHSSSPRSPRGNKKARSMVQAAAPQMPVPPLHQQPQRRTTLQQQQSHHRSSQQQHPKRTSQTSKNAATAASAGASSLFFSNSTSAIEQAKADAGEASDYDAELDDLVVQLRQAGKNTVSLKKQWKRKKANWSSDKFNEWFARAEKQAKELDMEQDIIQKVSKAVAQLGSDKMKDLELVRETVGGLRPVYRKQLESLANLEFKTLWKRVREQVGKNNGMVTIPPMNKKRNSEQQQQQSGRRKPPPEVANALAAAAAEASAADDALAGPPIKKKRKQAPVEAGSSLLKGAGRLDSDPSTTAPVARTSTSRPLGTAPQDHQMDDDDNNHTATMPMDESDDEHGSGNEPQKEPLLSAEEVRLRKIVQEIDDESEASGHTVPLQTILEQNREKWEKHLVTSGPLEERLTKAEFGTLWERVNRRACENWEQRIQTKPMDWSFLVFGKQFDAKKATDYFGGWDTIVKANDNDI